MLHRGTGKAKLCGMEQVRTLAALQRACQGLRQRFGALALVPTMGALHDGHKALVRAALTTGAAVIASIFVNPLQFHSDQDLSRYPRDETGDLIALEASGCHLVWLPDVGVMYPSGDATTIDVRGPAEPWEGVARPEHFRGVATVCAKLFGQVRPNRAFFGEKDWQQLQVVRRMVADLHLQVEIVSVPTVREETGLALSSRNRFLTAQERALAPRLYSVLTAARHALARDEPSDAVLAVARRTLVGAGFSVDYLALVDGSTMQALAAPLTGSRVILAARLGSVRLIDNLGTGD
jgi:pantoate--beta-alanine ligase